MHHRQMLSGITESAKVLALPGMYAPTRYPSFPALERTSVLSFKQQATISLSSTQHSGFLSRSPTHPLWLEQSGGYSYGITYYIEQPAAQVVDTFLLSYPVYNPDAYFVGSIQSNTSDSGKIQINGAIPPGIDYPVMGIDGTGPPYMWVPANYNLVFVFKASAISGGVVAPDTNKIQIQAQVWRNPGEWHVVNLVAFSLTADIAGGTYFTGSYDTSVNTQFPQTGVQHAGYWIRLMDFQLVNGGNITIGENANFKMFVLPYQVTASLDPSSTYTTSSCSATPAMALLPVFTVPEFAVSNVPWSSTRLTALSVLFTNVTKALNKEGTVQAARLNPETDVFMTSSTGITTSLLSTRHPSEKALLGLEEGFYTYSVPSTDLANFWDHTLKVNPSTNAFNAGSPLRTGLVPVYRLDNAGLVNAFVFEDNDTSTITSLAINLDCHIEFRSTSTLWPIGLSQMSLEAFHQAQIALVSAGFFFNNKDHSTVMGIIKSIAKTIGGPILGTVGPAALAAGKTFLDEMSGNIIMPQKTDDTRATGLSVKADRPPKQIKPPAVVVSPAALSKRQRKKARALLAKAQVASKAKPARKAGAAK